MYIDFTLWNEPLSKKEKNMKFLSYFNKLNIIILIISNMSIGFAESGTGESYSGGGATKQHVIQEGNDVYMTWDEIKKRVGQCNILDGKTLLQHIFSPLYPELQNNQTDITSRFSVNLKEKQGDNDQVIGNEFSIFYSFEFNKVKNVEKISEPIEEVEKKENNGFFSLFKKDKKEEPIPDKIEDPNHIYNIYLHINRLILRNEFNLLTYELTNDETLPYTADIKLNERYYEGFNLPVIKFTASERRYLVDAYSGVQGTYQTYFKNVQIEYDDSGPELSSLYITKISNGNKNTSPNQTMLNFPSKKFADCLRNSFSY